MRDGPLWPALKATAHTLVYESFIPGSLPPDRLAAITTPALVVASQRSTGQLRDWAQAVADALPNAAARFLPGTWHGVPPEHLAPAPLTGPHPAAARNRPAAPPRGPAGR
jgi:hypothetical protein